VPAWQAHWHAEQLTPAFTPLHGVTMKLHDIPPQVHAVCAGENPPW
jgi:hypothetical protein